LSIHQDHVQSPGDPHLTRCDERWTLARQDAGWRLVEYDVQPLEQELVSAPQVISEIDDHVRRREEAVEEQADAPQPATAVTELVNATDTPERQLLDLSLVDDRFAPVLLEATLTHLTRAWQESRIEGDSSLQSLASPTAINQLRRPDSARSEAMMIIRDASLGEWHIERLTDRDEGPAIEVSLTVLAVRYLQRPHTGERGQIGVTDIRHQIHLRWTLVTTGHASPSWMLTASSNPAVDIPQAMT
jgi:hypothetical protein